MIKRFLFIIIIGVVCLILGIGGGVFLGIKFFGSPQTIHDTSGDFSKPGAIINLGDFTVNLADKEPHIARFNLALELADPTLVTEFSDEGWISKMKNEVILTCKDRYYDDLRTADGVMALAQDITKRLNAILPAFKGGLPVRSALFQEFILQ